MTAVLLVLLIVGCGVLVRVVVYHARGRTVAFADRVPDPLFGQLAWQGYGDGDWWQGALPVDGTIVTVIIGGSTAPDRACVAAAHTLVATYASFQHTLDQFLQTEAQRRPQDAVTIAQLVVTRIALFPAGGDDDLDGYQGVFVLLHDRALHAPQPVQDIWRCNSHDGHFANLRVWT